MNLPFYHCYSLLFKNRAEFIPLLDHKVKTDCYYQEPNWHKGRTTSIDVLEIRSSQCPRDIRSYMAKSVSNNRNMLLKVIEARQVLTRYRESSFIIYYIYVRTTRPWNRLLREAVQSSHPLRFSRPDWIKPWATWSGLIADPPLHFLKSLLTWIIPWS